MATRLFTYGSPKMVIIQNQWLAGQFATAWGVNVNAVGIKATALAIEYGELVKLTETGMAGNSFYTVERVASETTKFGVILRTTDGQIGLEEGFIERPRGNNMSIYPLAGANFFMVAVPIIASQSVTIGAVPYACIVSGSEGALQAGSANFGIALTGWAFASLPYAPTKGAGLCALITKTV